MLVTHAGRFQAKVPAARIPERAWQRLSAMRARRASGNHDWAAVDIHGPAGSLGHSCLLPDVRVPDVSVEGWQSALDLVAEKGWKHRYSEGGRWSQRGR
ncbi:hypothetical protein FNH09_45395 [Streptomyces adustus]|uniref:Uncharacterized protein n=1 Tax=Streptomyces adustus TaxID=1609272 RepID=A0A5N8VTR8_9ACTN|nr:hypothetical protein [Streptomyces adustus]